MKIYIRLKINNSVLVYPKHFKDDYCLARVIKVHLDKDNLVGKDGDKSDFTQLFKLGGISPYFH